MITSLYISRKNVYSDPPFGGFERIRLFCYYFILVSYFLLPWIEFDSRKMLLFDLENNKFYFFGKIFFPNDLILLALFLILIIILLFGVTLYAGRVWCGYLCPQTVWVKLYNLISRLIEGNRNNRIKLDSSTFSFKKIAFKFFKHFLWLILAFFTSITFVAYFVTIDYLLDMLSNFEFKTLSFFWVIFFTVTTYFDAGWFCEQFCFLVCPYARLQAVMFDKNTLIVAYDYGRGEIRGSRLKGIKYDDLGDCVDCKRCVNVCPTGIDIRDGLQIECISCAACIDACNPVMKKLGYSPNLIRYTGKSVFQLSFMENIRFFAYTVTIVLLSVVFFCLLYFRPLVNFDVIRDQSVYGVIKDDIVENNYLIKLINKSTKKNDYIVFLKDSKFKYHGVKNITLESCESTSFFIKLFIKKNDLIEPFNDVVFILENVNPKNKFFLEKKSKFISLF